MTAWTAETLPPALVALHDAPGGTSLTGLAAILNAYDEWRDEQDRPMPPDTGRLCCCGSGQDCPACLTGRCFECLDNPERERYDEDDLNGWDQEWGDEDD